ncbi:hypothetical protein BAE44_0022008 [Dichanthelium oligosanthes]|uniref:Uncharacterized protein n=1 Tax=Dichanthelium oligosanthes TaxID=888268 RepID=A0A1E5UVQ9_9POAL|nr:hypothetical protein BAE44_0022008 [Dichanthelium oligosanthes]
MAAVKAYVLLFTAFFFSGLMQLSMAAQDNPATVAATARVIDTKAVDQAIAYLLIHQINSLAKHSPSLVPSAKLAPCHLINLSAPTTEESVAKMAAVKVYVLLLTAFFFSGLMQLSMAQDKPAAAATTARVVDGKSIDQAIAYLLMFAALFVTYFAH